MRKTTVVRRLIRWSCSSDFMVCGRSGQWMREVNVACRWLLGLKLRDKVPDASTLSRKRRRRFAGSTIYQEIFDEIVLLAVNKGLASGSGLYTEVAASRAGARRAAGSDAPRGSLARKLCQATSMGAATAIDE